MKFVHCADIHLDSPLRGLESYEGAPVEKMRGAARSAFVNVVNLCIEQAVDFLLIAGDLYDGDWKDFNTGLFFTNQMVRLRQAGIRAFLIQGNHDAESHISKRLQLPDNVTRFGSSRPETVRDDRLRVAVHGQSFATAHVDCDLASSYPEPVAGYFNIGLLHTSVNGREGHAPYAPCHLDTLRNKGYDYWALGHVHKREILHEEGTHVVFPGNLQGRHIRETGAKGCMLVTVGEGQIRSAEFVPTDVLRWAHAVVDCAGARTEADILERVRESMTREHTQVDGHPLAIRLVLQGRCPAFDTVARDVSHLRGQVEAVCLDAGLGDIWVEKVKVELEPPYDVSQVRERDDALGELLRAIHATPSDAAAMQAIRDDLGALLAKLPAEVREGQEGLNIDRPEAWPQVLKDVEAILLTRLQAEGVAE